MSEYALSSKLRKLLWQNGNLTLSELSRNTQIPQPTLHHIIEGKTKNPRRKVLKALSEFFSISIPELCEEKSDVNDFDVAEDCPKVFSIPLLTWLQAKALSEGSKNMPNYIKLGLKIKDDKNIFAIKMDNPNMEPLFPENCLLIFNQDREPKDRDFVLTYLSELNIINFNRLFVDGKKSYIKKENHNKYAELIELDLSVNKIIATLIEARLQF